MGATGRVVGRSLAIFAGRARYQRTFRRLHSATLAGRNYGPSDVARSGEIVALRHMRTSVPDATVIFDVGANAGDWTTQAAHLWPTANIHAFEPSVAMYRKLEKTTAELNVTCVRSAVSDHVGEAVLHGVLSQSGLSSLYERDLSTHGMSMTEQEVVALVTIDEYCIDNNIAHIDVLKIDAEGHDLAVLVGSAGMLAEGRIGFVQFEFGGANIDSRTFLRDFINLLGPSHDIFRLLVDGLEKVIYSEREEVFITANYLAGCRR